ncbi:MAG: CoA-binding protein [Ignavibacteria bacterium]|jgi:predicted CoA-binding protein|nr:CoA-binding protein [Ignavibacteria bacterium]MCU7501988.1 CoA-binding protein [Ignavibacteria bacterium]MCU7516956.1 CoA-binding protein [Ignavibacteria bacterium]
MAVTFNQIQDFLSKKRIAFIGISRDEKNYTRNLFREMTSRGYDVVPVNPNATEIEGLKCYGRLSQVSPGPEAALIFTTSLPLESLMDECLASGIKNVWVYNPRDKGRAVKPVEDFSRDNGINFISGYCPFMFLKDSAFVHRLHGFFLRLSGSYPARERS